ncbi:Transmembrane protein [Pseudolycoriella hygida]|uniref:Transmembrane protein n=1 Tax=Pseudolycoriella hygida TaxID=35572 RepID=A0A9Q0NF13_9DIPT|nr:Transmembrane protein [Pseudolycoriella hygida]
MSEKWEIVGKGKKSKQQMPLKDGKLDKKSVTKKPTAEEIFDKYALKNIKENKENKKPNGVVKNQKDAKVAQHAASAPPKVKGISVPRKPNTIEAAFEQFNVNRLNAEIEALKVNFPNNHLVWLKGLHSHLNVALNVKNPPLVIDRPIRYPSNIVPAEVKAIIYNLLNEAGPANIQYFFDQSLTTLAVDLSNNVNCIGHNVLLQLIALKWPTVCTQNLAKNAILRNSYQNRSAIGLNLLWALGQGGFSDASVGCRVWQNIMVPVLEMRAYTKWVCEYIHKVLKNAEDDIDLAHNEFLVIYDELVSQRNGLPKDCQKLLSDSASILLSKRISNSSKLLNVFLALFTRLTTAKSNILEPALIECLIKDNECFKIWKKIYAKNFLETKILLSYLAKNWKNLPAAIKQNSSLKDFLGSLELVNLSFEHHLVQEINQLTKTIQVQQEKTQIKAKSCSSCRWLFGSFLLFVVISSLLAYDTHTHGGVFAKSATGKFLQQTGTLPYVEIAWTKTMSTSARGYKWAEKNVPVYVNETCTAIKPYTIFLRDVGIVAWSVVRDRCEAVKLIILDKTPVVVNFIDQYAPGFPSKVQEFSISLWNSICSTSKNLYSSSYEFLMKNVFVGNLSPENLNQAINRTQIAAAEYYSWFHKKVDAYAKIQ